MSWLKIAQSSSGITSLIHRMRYAYCKYGYAEGDLLDKMNKKEIIDLFNNNSIKRKYILTSLKSNNGVFAADVFAWAINKGLNINQIDKNLLTESMQNIFYTSYILYKSKNGLDNNMTVKNSIEFRRSGKINYQKTGYEAICNLIKEISENDLYELVPWHENHAITCFFINPFKKNTDDLCYKWDPPVDIVIDRYLSYSDKFIERVGILQSSKWSINRIKSQEMHDLLNNKQDFMSIADGKVISSLKHENNPLGNTWAIYRAGYNVLSLPDRWFFLIFDSLRATYVDLKYEKYFNLYIGPELYDIFTRDFNLPDSRIPSELIEIVKNKANENSIEKYDYEGYGYDEGQ